MQTREEPKRKLSSKCHYGIQGVVLTANLLDAPKVNDQGRVSRNWIQSFLQTEHAEVVARGISIIVSRVPESLQSHLGEWHGNLTDGSSPGPQLSPWKAHKTLLREVLASRH